MSTVTLKRTVVLPDLSISHPGVNKEEALSMKIGKTFAPLSEAIAIQRGGYYWIGSQGLSAFADPSHQYYTTNKDGTLNRVSEKEYYKSDWERRIYITKGAAIKASKNEDPLLLFVAEDLVGSRLYLYSGESVESVGSAVFINKELAASRRQ